jgi:hypothetical protein
MSELIFTRYLYVKQEVFISLLVSLLNKKDDVLFWVFELYYSGFKKELFDFIWKIYYDFYYTLNPSYEAYLIKKYKNINQELDDKKVIASIFQDLLFRPFNSDIFFIRNVCEQFEVEIEVEIEFYKDNALNINLEQWINKKDYRSIAGWIFSENKNSIKNIEIYELFLEICEKKGFLKENKLTKSKLIKNYKNVINLDTRINENVILFSKIMEIFSRINSLKKGRSIYINVEDEEIINFETIKDVKHYKILEKAYICGIDDLKHLSLFQLKRNKYNLTEEYRQNWLYYASFSPLWRERINKYGGQIDNQSKKIHIKDDDLLEEFYEHYGLEPDEQKLSVQYKSIQPIEKKYDWKWFNNKYKKNGLFEIYEEELEEFNVEGLLY